MLGRILFADQEPLNYTVTFLPEKVFPGIDRHSLTGNRFIRYFRKSMGSD